MRSFQSGFRTRATIISLIAALSVAALYVYFRAAFIYRPTLEDMAGQMIMIGFPGSTVREDWPHTVADQIREGTVGGVIMLGYNFKNKEDVIGLTQLFRDAAQRKELPPFIALDQEGGFVQRLGKKLGYSPLPPAKEIATTMTPTEAQSIFDALAANSRDAGFNVNLAPVVDLEVDATNPGIGSFKRSYGNTAETVIAYAEKFIISQQNHSLLPVLKHFPVHGSSSVDPHVDFADISKSWLPEEMKPFQALGSMNPAPGIMVGHLLHHELTGDEPASLSPQAIHKYLRSDLGFKGVVICDDLQMPAITKRYALDEAMILAVKAGVDIVIISNTVTPDPHLPDKLVALICKAVKEGRLDQKLVEQSYQRIVHAKKALSQK